MYFFNLGVKGLILQNQKSRLPYSTQSANERVRSQSVQRGTSEKSIMQLQQFTELPGQLHCSLISLSGLPSVA